MDRHGRDVEFDQFVLARSAHLRRTAYLVVHDWHAAEDVVQTVLVKMYVGWHRVRRDGLDAYARRAVVNASISHTRRHRRELLAGSVPDAPQTSDQDVPQPVLEALSTLPPVQRAVAAMRFLDDMSVADVAATLGVSESTVKTHTSRALATLRRLVPALVASTEEDG